MYLIFQLFFSEWIQQCKIQWTNRSCRELYFKVVHAAMAVVVLFPDYLQYHEICSIAYKK